MPSIPDFRDLQRQKNSVHSFQNVMRDISVSTTYDSKINNPINPDVSFSKLLLENGNTILQENNSNILLDQS